MELQAVIETVKSNNGQIMLTDEWRNIVNERLPKQSRLTPHEFSQAVSISKRKNLINVKRQDGYLICTVSDIVLS